MSSIFSTGLISISIAQERQPDFEAGAVSHRAAQTDFALVDLGHPLHDRQAQPTSAGRFFLRIFHFSLERWACSIHTIKTLKEMALMFFCDAWPIVLYPEASPLSLPFPR